MILKLHWGVQTWFKNNNIYCLVSKTLIGKIKRKNIEYSMVHGDCNDSFWPHPNKYMDTVMKPLSTNSQSVLLHCMKSTPGILPKNENMTQPLWAHLMSKSKHFGNANALKLSTD